MDVRAPVLDVLILDGFSKIAGDATAFVPRELDSTQVEPVTNVRVIENAGEGLVLILDQTDRFADVAPPFPARIHIIDPIAEKAQ